MRDVLSMTTLQGASYTTLDVAEGTVVLPAVVVDANGVQTAESIAERRLWQSMSTNTFGMINYRLDRALRRHGQMTGHGLWTYLATQYGTRSQQLMF